MHKREIIIHMKKIKSMLELILVKLKKPGFEQIYQQLKQEVLIAYQSKHHVWGILVVYLGIGISSFVWIFATIYQHFHDQDDISMTQSKPLLPVNLPPNHLFMESPKRNQEGFNVPYQLSGILFDEDSAKREVMLRLPSGEVKSYRLGDELPDGVKILDIDSFQVKLEKNGQQKTLKLDQYRRDFLSDKPKSGQSLF